MNEGLLLGDEVEKLLTETFAQTVEYGGMCTDCCCAEDDNGDKEHVYCSESDHPLKPDEYCPQQIACIKSTVPKIIARCEPLIRAKTLREVRDIMLQHDTIGSRLKAVIDYVADNLKQGVEP